MEGVYFRQRGWGILTDEVIFEQRSGQSEPLTRHMSGRRVPDSVQSPRGCSRLSVFQEQGEGQCLKSGDPEADPEVRIHVQVIYKMLR